MRIPFGNDQSLACKQTPARLMKHPPDPPVGVTLLLAGPRGRLNFISINYFTANERHDDSKVGELAAAAKLVEKGLGSTGGAKRERSCPSSLVLAGRWRLPGAGAVVPSD